MATSTLAKPRTARPTWKTVLWASLGLIALFAAWLTAAWLIYAATLGSYEPAGLGDLISRVFTSPEGWTLIGLGMLVGFVFACLTLALTLVSFPMVVDTAADPFTAVATSVRAVMENPKTPKMKIMNKINSWSKTKL